MNSRYQSGYVLVTGLIFVVVIAVLGISGMQSSNLEYRMSSNTAFKKQSFERSESGRSAVTQILSEHLNQAGTWPSYLTIPTGLTVSDKDTSGGADDLAINATGETPANPTTDAVFTADFSGNGSTETQENVNISVYNLKSVYAIGAGIGFSQGTKGLGKGAGAGGAHVMMQVQSDGLAAASAKTHIVTDYRHVTK